MVGEWRRSPECKAALFYHLAHEVDLAGFNRLAPLRKNAGNQEVASSRNEVLTEMTNIVGSALLGVTLGCARCHDHKFDPIPQKEYYALQAVFAGVDKANREYDPDARVGSERRRLLELLSYVR